MIQERAAPLPHRTPFAQACSRRTGPEHPPRRIFMRALYMLWSAPPRRGTRNAIPRPIPATFMREPEVDLPRRGAPRHWLNRRSRTPVPSASLNQPSRNARFLTPRPRNGSRQSSGFSGPCDAAPFLKGARATPRGRSPCGVPCVPGFDEAPRREGRRVPAFQAPGWMSCLDAYAVWCVRLGSTS